MGLYFAWRNTSFTLLHHRAQLVARLLDLRVLGGGGDSCLLQESFVGILLRVQNGFGLRLHAALELGERPVGFSNPKLRATIVLATPWTFDNASPMKWSSNSALPTQSSSFDFVPENFRNIINSAVTTRGLHIRDTENSPVQHSTRAEPNIRQRFESCRRPMDIEQCRRPMDI